MRIKFHNKILTIEYIVDKKLAAKAVKKLVKSKATVLGADTETGHKEKYRDHKQAGLDPYLSFISLLQIYDPDSKTIYLFDTFYIPIKSLQDIFTHKRVIFHNAIFDFLHLTYNGITDIKADCSMVMYNIYRTSRYTDMEDEEEGEGVQVDFITKKDRFGGSLQAVSAKLLGLKVEKEKQTSNWTDRPLDDKQIMYAAIDSYLTYEVGKKISKYLVEDKLADVYILNRDAMTPVCSMILNGCAVDVKKHKKNIANWETDKERALEQTRKIFGRINLRSAQQISNWMANNVEKSLLNNWGVSEKTGNYKTDANTFKDNSHLPFVVPLLSYKKTEKLISTYGESMLKMISPETKRLHPWYTLGYTATGRLSSRNPNIQNWPSGKEFRGIFVSPKGRSLVGADYGQIEMRVAAHISKDKTMLRAFEEGSDLHRLVASVLTNKRIEDITDDERKRGKACNFGLLFGMGAPGLQRYARQQFEIHMTLEESQLAVKAFRQAYSGYAAWQKRQREACGRVMRVSSMRGKRRKLGENFLYTCSVNHPIQATAAEIMLQALCNIYKSIDNPDIKMLMCVHDEVLLECRDSLVERTKEIIQTSMEKSMLDIFPSATTRGLVDVKTGKSWDDCH